MSDVAKLGQHPAASPPTGIQPLPLQPMLDGLTGRPAATPAPAAPDPGVLDTLKGWLDGLGKTPPTPTPTPTPKPVDLFGGSPAKR